jgi:hypothetical protein
MTKRVYDRSFRICDKIKLYKYYPSSGALADDKIELAFQKSTEETPVSLYETRFYFGKKEFQNISKSVKI